jgi:hypothetical protein
MEQWEIDLRKQLQEVNKKTWEEKLKEETSQPKEKDYSYLYWVFIIILSITTLVTIEYKNKGAISQWINSRVKYAEEPVSPPKQNLEERILLLERKAAALGYATDENFYILKNDLEKSNIIFINRDWSLSKEPEYIQLTPEDENYIRKHLSGN